MSTLLDQIAPLVWLTRGVFGTVRSPEPRRLESFVPGSHIAVSRWLYTHHGIYEGWYYGEECVIHYSGNMFNKFNAVVERTTLQQFAGDGEPYLFRPGSYQTLERARSKIGESRYSLLNNNCEDLCNTCTGEGSFAGGQAGRLKWGLGTLIWLLIVL